MARPRIAVIILNWNGWRDTIECLESVYRIKYPDFDVVLVDNCSCDGSVDYVLTHFRNRLRTELVEYHPILPIDCTGLAVEFIPRFPLEAPTSNGSGMERLTIIESDANYGFAEGNNIGIRYAIERLAPSYVLLLNNDTIVEESFLAKLIDVAETDPKIGIAGPRILYHDFNGRNDVVNSAGGEMNFWTGRASSIGIGSPDGPLYHVTRDVDYVNGACMLTRVDFIRKVGLLPADYFLYWEENNWCERGKRVDQRIVIVGEAVVWHKCCSSIKMVRLTGNYFFVLNRFKFMRQFATKGQYRFFLLYFFLFKMWAEVVTLLSESPKAYREALRCYSHSVVCGVRADRRCQKDR